ncbi:putative solute carrier family 40 member 1 [Apostichopus japonicus]|uniref:Solute carrier family 40 member n=1 Tax=Stichopus japonicus TaxID=307972 RepID=A0A2G8JIC0_STIJA|nr:putative solute carrier family 40 member 1 [Apostichopus japonicus]
MSNIEAIVDNDELAQEYEKAADEQPVSKEETAEEKTGRRISWSAIWTWLTSYAFFVYASQALSSWGDRMWSFAVGLYLVEIDGSLRLTAIYGFSLTASVLIFGAVVGRWVDRTSRLRAIQISLFLQNSFVAINAAAMCVLVVKREELPDWVYAILAVAIICLGVCAKLTSIAEKICVQKDWIVVIAGEDKEYMAGIESMPLVDATCSVRWRYLRDGHVHLLEEEDRHREERSLLPRYPDYYAVSVHASSCPRESVRREVRPHEEHHGECHRVLVTDRENVESHWSAGLFFGGMILSRIGLWAFDLVLSQQIQESVEEHHRGIFNGIQSSLQSSFDMIHFILVIGLPCPESFGYLIFASYLFVCLGAAMYARFSYRREVTFPTSPEGMRFGRRYFQSEVKGTLIVRSSSLANSLTLKPFRLLYSG